MYSEEKDLDAKYESVKKKVYEFISSTTLAHDVLGKIYSVDTVENVNRLLEIEDGDFSKISDVVTEVKGLHKKGENQW